MGNRLYTGAVIVFWLAAMAWLVTNRILPPFFSGEAPPTSLAYQVQPVAWQIELDGELCGFAVLQAVKSDSGTREVHSLLRLDRLPAPKQAPFWLRPLLSSLKDLAVEMRTRTTYDGLGSLASFQTKMRVNQLETPIKVTGRIIDEELRLQIRAGDMTRRLTKAWSRDAALGGELAPTSRLLPLWEGRRWTQEIYSPFASPKAPLELLEGVVTGQVLLTKNGVSAKCWTVEYRTTEMTGSTNEERLRARLYVNEIGSILKQEAFLLGSKITFWRQSEQRSIEMANEFLDLAKYATSYDISMQRGEFDAAADSFDAGSTTTGRSDSSWESVAQ